MDLKGQVSALATDSFSGQHLYREHGKPRIMSASEKIKAKGSDLKTSTVTGENAIPRAPRLEK